MRHTVKVSDDKFGRKVIEMRLVMGSLSLAMLKTEPSRKLVLEELTKKIDTALKQAATSGVGGGGEDPE